MNVWYSGGCFSFSLLVDKSTFQWYNLVKFTPQERNAVMFFAKAIYCRGFQVAFRLDLPMRYQPCKSNLYEKLLHLFLK